MWRCGLNPNYTDLGVERCCARFHKVRSVCRLKAFCFESCLSVFLCVSGCVCKQNRVCSMSEVPRKEGTLGLLLSLFLNKIIFQYFYNIICLLAQCQSAVKQTMRRSQVQNPARTTQFIYVFPIHKSRLLIFNLLKYLTPTFKQFLYIYRVGTLFIDAILKYIAYIGIDMNVKVC